MDPGLQNGSQFYKIGPGFTKWILVFKSGPCFQNGRFFHCESRFINVVPAFTKIDIVNVMVNGGPGFTMVGPGYMRSWFCGFWNLGSGPGCTNCPLI